MRDIARREFSRVCLTGQSAGRAIELGVVAVAAQDLKSFRVAIGLEPAPQFCPARAQAVCLSMCTAIAVHVIELKEPDIGHSAARALTVRIAAAIVGENFQP